MLTEGDKAPDFDLATDGGSRISLNALKGGLAVIFFYPKDDTSGCTKEAIAFTGLKAEFEAAGATIIGISPDSAASHDRFKAKHDLEVTLGADPDKTVLNDYGVWVEKSMYGRKYMGVERSTFIVDSDGNIAKVWRKVRVPGHAEKVLEAVQSMQG